MQQMYSSFKDEQFTAQLHLKCSFCYLCPSCWLLQNCKGRHKTSDESMGIEGDIQIHVLCCSSHWKANMISFSYRDEKWGHFRVQRCTKNFCAGNERKEGTSYLWFAIS